MIYWPPGSNEGNMLHELGFPIKIIPFEGDWFDAATIYKEWVIPNAMWTKPGKLIDRPEVPQWVYNITTWLVTGLFENFQGMKDARPEAVAKEVKSMVEILNLPKDSVALHYYEWDYLGYDITDNYTLHENCEFNTNYFPEDPNPCGFDTHYGDYFPARIGFEDAIKSLQDFGVRVVPYTNGRLIDTNT